MGEPSEQLENCRQKIEDSFNYKLLDLEKRVFMEIIQVKGTVQNTDKVIRDFVSRPEFEPVRMIAFGLAGGVMIAALGAIFAKVLGW